MKLHSGLEIRQLLQMLGKTIEKEQESWKAVVYKTETPMEVCGQQRDEIVKWLIQVNAKFHFTPETMALAVSLTDRFLHLVKVRPKYLQCVAVSCFYIAAKTLEEDEVIPSTVDLVKTSRCTCCVADILRMEGIILDKFNWNIRSVTAVDYLHIIHALLMSYYPQLLEVLGNLTPSSHLTQLLRNVFHCLGRHELAQFRPITLALAVVSLELEQVTPAWLSIISSVQKMAEVDISELIRCREFVTRLLKAQNIFQKGYHLKSRPVARTRSTKRKAEHVELEDDVYDGIKRLYNEDLTSPGPTVALTCGSELGQTQDRSVTRGLGKTQHPVSAN